MMLSQAGNRYGSALAEIMGHRQGRQICPRIGAPWREFSYSEFTSRSWTHCGDPSCPHIHYCYKCIHMGRHDCPLVHIDYKGDPTNGVANKLLRYACAGRYMALYGELLAVSKYKDSIFCPKCQDAAMVALGRQKMVYDNGYMVKKHLLFAQHFQRMWDALCGGCRYRIAYVRCNGVGVCPSRHIPIPYEFGIDYDAPYVPPLGKKIVCTKTAFSCGAPCPDCGPEPPTYVEHLGASGFIIVKPSTANSKGRTIDVVELMGDPQSAPYGIIKEFERLNGAMDHGVDELEQVRLEIIVRVFEDFIRISWLAAADFALAIETVYPGACQYLIQHSPEILNYLDDRPPPVVRINARPMSYSVTWTMSPELIERIKEKQSAILSAQTIEDITGLRAVS